MKSFYLFLLFFTLSIPAALAQLRGRVTDTQTGEPIGRASVEVGKQRAIADEEGYYGLSNLAPGKYPVVVRCVGYQPFTSELIIKSGKTQTQGFSLQTQVVELGQLAVQGTEARQTKEIETLRKSALSVTVIDARAFANRSVTMSEVLNQQAGMRIRQTGGLGGDTQISLRGMEGKRVQLYIDDNPVYAPDGSLGLNDIPISNFSRIEVYKGFVPAYLGADGLGGAINSVSRERYQEQLELSATRSSYNGNNVTGYYKKNLLNAGIAFSVGATATYAQNDYVMKSRGELQPGLSIVRDHDRYKNFIGTAGVEFTRAWFDDFSINLTHYENEKQIQGVATNIRHAFTTSNVWAEVLNLKKTDFFKKGLDFRFSLIGSHSQARFIDTASYRVDFYGQRVEVMGEVQPYRKNATNLQDDYRARTNFQYQLTEKTSLNFNNVTRIAKLDPNDPVLNALAGRNVSHFPGEIRSTVFGLTYEANWLNERLQGLLIGKYYDFYSSSRIATYKFSSEINSLPDLITNQLSKTGYGTALRYKITPDLLVRASFERAFRMPQPSELFGNGLTIAANSRLRPEQAANLNLSAQLDKTFARNRRLQVELSGFASNLTDYIQLGPGPSFVISSYVNYPKASLRGAELEIKADVSQHLFASFNTTYQLLRDESEFILGSTVPNFSKGLRIPNIPFFFTNFSAEFHKANLFGGTGMNTRLIYENAYTGRFTYDFEIPKTFTTYAIPAYMAHTVSVEQSFQNGKYSLGVEAYNLTDALIINNLNNPLPGRVWRVKFRYFWKKAFDNQS